MNVSHTLPLFLALHRPKHANTLGILRNLSEFICLPHTIISFEFKKYVFLHFYTKRLFLKNHVFPNSGIFPSIHFFASIFRKIAQFEPISGLSPRTPKSALGIRIQQCLFEKKCRLRSAETGIMDVLCFNCIRNHLKSSGLQ
jgi:hypothetical protein